MLLTLPDLMLLMASLEVLYLLAQLGEVPCSKIASVDRSIGMNPLLSYVSLLGLTFQFLVHSSSFYLISDSGA